MEVQLVLGAAREKVKLELSDMPEKKKEIFMNFIINQNAGLWTKIGNPYPPKHAVSLILIL